MGVFIAEVVREGVGLSTGDALLYTPQESDPQMLCFGFAAGAHARMAVSDVMYESLERGSTGFKRDLGVYRTAERRMSGWSTAVTSCRESAMELNPRSSGIVYSAKCTQYRNRYLQNKGYVCTLQYKPSKMSTRYQNTINNAPPFLYLLLPIQRTCLGSLWRPFLRSFLFPFLHVLLVNIRNTFPTFL